MKMHFLMTIDVECFSIPLNRCDLFADVIRHKLKLKNLGLASLRLLDEVITNAKEYGFEFVSAGEYKRIFDN